MKPIVKVTLAVGGDEQSFYLTDFDMEVSDTLSTSTAPTVTMTGKQVNEVHNVCKRPANHDPRCECNITGRPIYISIAYPAQGVGE